MRERKFDREKRYKESRKRNVKSQGTIHDLQK